MNPIIYFDGQVADDLGGRGIQAILNTISTALGRPVEALTHGTSKYNANMRRVGKVGEDHLPAAAILDLGYNLH